MSRLMFKVIISVAEKEFLNARRDMRVIAISAIFTLLALGIAYFGSAPTGQVSFRGFDVTVASLVSLAIFIVPLVALLLGYDAIVGEKEKSTLGLLLALPVTRAEVLIGKFVGLSGTLVLSITAGFGLAGIVIGLEAGLEEASSYLVFIATSILLGMVFLSLALLLSTLASEKSKAIFGAIFFWFFFVIIYDLALLGLLISSDGAISPRVFSFLLMLNPTDVFRILNLIGLEEVRASLGLATLIPAAYSSAVFVSALAAWVVLPLLAAVLVFRRRGY
jgi:Cu-processing system permease protein